ncbi:MAG: PDZ domain-containing protein [Gemmatimonadaceae bacterium]
MRVPSLPLAFPLLTATVLASASVLPAQGTTSRDRTPSPDRATIERAPDVRVFMRGDEMGAKSMIGVSTSSTGPRDTLGLLVTSVTPNGPAEKAGIVEGNRIAAINGVNLRLAAADAGEDDMQGITARRLTRELSKIDPGTEVELRIYADGQWKNVKVKTVSPDSLMPARFRRSDSDDRAVLGLELNSTGSKRDTLGVLIGALHEDGPAEKAGLIEGDRIISINGTDLRVRHDDAGDDWVSSAMVSRFQRAMRSVKPGDKVELRVWSGGQTKSVSITAAKASELYKDRFQRIRIGNGPMIWSPDGSEMFFGNTPRAMIAPVPAVPPVPPMPFMYAPRARVQTFDMDDTTDRPDEAARAGAAARAGQRARAAVERSIMSSAANIAGAAPAIAATWSRSATLAARDAETATRSTTIRLPGLSIAPVTSELAEYLGKGSKGGYLVLESSGQWSALRAGDVLLSVDGHCVSDGITTDDGSHNVVVLRKGQKLTLDVVGG